MAQFWKTLKRHWTERADSRLPESTHVDVDYLTLEPRRVLNADFTLLGGVLDLDNFSESTDENLSITQIPNFYQFELDEGTWSGVNTTLAIGNGTSILSVNSNFVSELSVLDSIGIDLDVTFGNANLSQLDSTTVVTTGSIDQFASSTLVAPMLDLAGDDIDLTNTNNDFDSIRLDATTAASISDIDHIEILSASAGDTIDVHSAGIDLTGNATAGSIWFESTQGLAQIGSSIVTTNELMLTGQGAFAISNPGNTISSLAADVDGSVRIAASTDLSIDTLIYNSSLSSSSTSVGGVDVSGDLMITLDEADLSQTEAIVIGGGTSFVVTGGNGDIVLENLNVTGAIGIATTAGDVRIVNQNSGGIVFRGDDIPGTVASGAFPHFEQSTVNGDLFAQATGGDITNEADATLEVDGTATLVAGTTNSSNVTGSNNEFRIKLGLASDDNIRLDALSASANQASLDLNGSVEFADTAIGTPSATGADGGTLFMSVDGSATQDASVLLSADNVAIVVSEHLLLSDIDADQVAFESNGFVDSSSLAGIPADLPDDNSDPFAPRNASVDVEYGIIVSSQNDLTITTISDALDCQQDLTGVSADRGHAFVQTLNSANIHFDGSGNTNTISANGSTFGLAADMQNGHVLTTVAGGDLTIADNTVLRSTSGSVTDISAFTTDEGVDFTNVTNEGPQFSLFLPTPSDDPTTKTVNTDDTQYIGLNFGRAGEQNFTVEVNWADGTIDVLEFDAVDGNRFERISHTFTNEFLLANFELPTFLNFSNDPAINLFDNGGQTNLNTNDGFILAFSDSRPQGDLVISAVSRPDAVLRETIIPINDTQISSENEVSELGQTETVVEEEVSDAYLIRLDEAGVEIKETRQDIEESNVIQDVIAQWKRRVAEGTQFPPASIVSTGPKAACPSQLSSKKALKRI